MFLSVLTGNGGGILLFLGEDIPSKLLPLKNNIESFFVETNYVIRKNGYLIKKALISNHPAELSKNLIYI